MPKQLYQIISPDGFDIFMDKEYLREEIEPSFNQWKERFKAQGYYSSVGRKIPLNALRGFCNVNQSNSLRYNSAEILASEDLYTLQDTFCSSGIPFQYELTEGEYQWAEFIKGKYSISDFVLENTDDNKVLTFWNVDDLKEAIEGDGMDNKAVMLDDATALQKLFFWLS